MKKSGGNKYRFQLDSSIFYLVECAFPFKWRIFLMQKYPFISVDFSQRCSKIFSKTNKWKIPGGNKWIFWWLKTLIIMGMAFSQPLGEGMIFPLPSGKKWLKVEQWKYHFFSQKVVEMPLLFPHGFLMDLLKN